MFDTLQTPSGFPFDAPSLFENHDHNLVVPLYSRAQAIADGALIDASPLAREIGFKDAVALTRRVHADCIAGDAEDAQLLNVLLPAVWALREQSHRRLREIVFTVLQVPPGRECDARSIDLKIIASPGDRGETVLTILSVDED